VGPRAGLDGCRKPTPTGIRSTDRPARSELLYRLSYPGPEKLCVTNIIVTLVYLSVLFCEWSSLWFARLILYKISKSLRTTGWFKKMDSISYVYISWTVKGTWMIYITFERGILNFQMPPLERSPSAQPCSNVSWEQNGYYVVQYFLRVSEENVRWIEERSERSPRKSTRRASRELGIPQPTVWRVLRRRLLFNWVHLF